MEAQEKPPFCPHCRKHIELKVEIRDIEPFALIYCKNCGTLLSIQKYEEFYKYLSTHLYPKK
jgi:transcription elongation factor Elf1